jgi:chromosomal replication initiation ATPase DnaA
MGKTLTEIAQELKNSPKKVQLIYAFNGVGKTRLSRAFKNWCRPSMRKKKRKTGILA